MDCFAQLLAGLLRFYRWILRRLGLAATEAADPGVEVVMDETGLWDKLRTADLVLTGEGRIDAQTAFGKTALGVAKLARDAGVRCIAVAGGVEPAGEAVLWELGAITFAVNEAPMSLEVAMAAGVAPVERCGRRLARLISAGSTIGG